jgi:nitrogen fixation protein NifQ
MTPHRTQKELVYAQLHGEELTDNQLWLACMIASWCVGNSVLPDYLGLNPDEFHALKQHCFPNQDLPDFAPSGKQLDFDRMLERQDLINLLKQHAQPERIETDWIIKILVAGCLGDDHLWQDLGLWSRSQLTELLIYNFPELATRNTHDMKWKKFLYKQLCEAEGLYLCRAPSCGVCVDYDKCYGSEEYSLSNIK